MEINNKLMYAILAVLTLQAVIVMGLELFSLRRWNSVVLLGYEETNKSPYIETIIIDDYKVKL